VVAYATVALAVLGFAGLVRAKQWPGAALFVGGFTYLGFVRFGSGNLYGFVKTVAYLVPLTSCLVAIGAAQIARIGRGPAIAAGAAISLVLAAQVAAATETNHMFLQLEPTISREQAALRGLPARMHGPGAVLIQDFSPPIPDTPLTVNSVLDHVVAYFITDRDVTITGPLLTPELADRFRFVVRTGAAPSPPGQYALLWQNAGLGVFLYGRA
ncbi:MAG: hypothetical protein ACRD0H_03975, partial [Actinomycetes bacterium]